MAEPGDPTSKESPPMPPSAAGESAAAVTPITNAILSKAVLSAIEQLDTKLAFDMMLLNEQLMAMDSENRALKDQVGFLKTQLAQQTQDASEMYHYFHGKLDHNVATIRTLEDELAQANARIAQLESDHDIAQRTMQTQFTEELRVSQAQCERLQEELQQLHAFSQQKRQMEDRVRELEEALVQRATELDEAQRSLERQFLVERDRTKKEMLSRLQSTKEALVTRTQDQVNTTTKRTMMENDHVLDELAFQSQETEKLLARHRDMEAELQALRVKTKMLEENEVALAKKSHYYQRLVRQLQGPQTSSMDVGSLKTASAQDELVAQETRHLQLRLREKDAEIARLQTRIVGLEAAAKRSQDWLHVFQQEKQFVVAQQDEVIQFLTRALHEISTATSSTTVDDEEKEHKSAMRGAVDGVTTMGELMVRAPSISLDELSTSENRVVLRLLLEKMKRYQDQVASVYRRSSGGGLDRELLAKQLGVELPPLAAAPNGSPLKVKRRVVVTTQTSMPTPTNAMASSPTTLKTLPSPSNQDKSRSGVAPSQVSTNPLLVVATASFNFTSPVSPTKAVTKAPRLIPESPTTGSIRRRKPNANANANANTTANARVDVAVAEEIVESSGTEPEPPGAGAISPPPSKSRSGLLTAWSTESLPPPTDQ
ncbi:hypothetical protein PINS_up013589 [Pythium insidiosum]|nr:hypothetical protein PINS_up013589 [Pythium insidiosum]